VDGIVIIVVVEIMDEVLIGELVVVLVVIVLSFKTFPLGETQPLMKIIPISSKLINIKFILVLLDIIITSKYHYTTKKYLKFSYTECLNINEDNFV